MSQGRPEHEDPYRVARRAVADHEREKRQGDPEEESGLTYHNRVRPTRTWTGWVRPLAIAVLASAGALLGLELRGSGGGPGRRDDVVVVYAQRPVSVHNAPDGKALVVRRLQAGEEVHLGTHGPTAWIEILDASGKRLGWVYQTRSNLLPTRPRLPPPTDTTALCTDGSSSFSIHSSGTCSQHGGVLCWRSHQDPQPVALSKPFCRSDLPDAQENS